MITVNAGFSRVLRKPNSVRRECRNVVGIQLDRKWNEPCDENHNAMRDLLRKHAPPGNGWTLEGYCLETPPESGEEDASGS